MKLLSRLAALSAALLLTVVVLPSTAYAKVPPEDPERYSGGVPPASNVVPPTVETAAGLSTLQVIAVTLCAAAVVLVLAAIYGRRTRPARATR